jgi:hypothetical protein
MRRAQEMAARLHPLLREGAVLERLLEHPAQQIEIAVEDTLEVQRAHVFDEALELREAAGLGALLDIRPEPWQTLRLYRAWVHAQRDAILRNGGVTLQALRGFADTYTAQYQQATGLRFPPEPPAVIENPPVRRFGRPSVIADDTVPLTQFSVVNGGFDEAVASFLLVGLAGGPESLPLIVNLTTGDAVLFRGAIAPGQRLWLRADPDGGLAGQLERQDVTDRLETVTAVTPGTPWAASQVRRPARAIRLRRGENRLWFLPVAHFDEGGLDRVLLALADLALAQGRWDEARFDRALFYQDPAVRLKVTWVETSPAAIEVRVPAQSVRRRVPATGTAEQAREQLGVAVSAGTSRLKAAGVRCATTLLSFGEMQTSAEFLTAVLPMRVREAGATGADRLPDKGGLFGVTDYGDSTFR